MIKGMAAAGRLLDRPDWIDSAERALRYLVEHHWRDGRLLATSRDGEARLNAYLDDYAYLVDATLEFLQARWNTEYLEFASGLADFMLDHFEDSGRGGFFFTSDDHEGLVYRPKPLGDDAMPSGNAIAVEALQTLASLGGDMRLQEAADRALRAAWPAIGRAPYAHVGLLEGLQHFLEPPEQLVIRGTQPELDDWRRIADTSYTPAKAVFAVPADAPRLPPGLADKEVRAGETLAYRCRGTHCEAPDPIPGITVIPYLPI